MRGVPIECNSSDAPRGPLSLKSKNPTHNGKSGAKRKYTHFRLVAPFQIREAPAFPPEPSGRQTKNPAQPAHRKPLVVSRQARGVGVTPSVYAPHSAQRNCTPEPQPGPEAPRECDRVFPRHAHFRPRNRRHRIPPRTASRTPGPHRLVRRPRPGTCPPFSRQKKPHPHRRGQCPQPSRHHSRRAQRPTDRQRLRQCLQSNRDARGPASPGSLSGLKLPPNPKPLQI